MLALLFIHRSVPKYKYEIVAEDAILVFSIIFILVIYWKVKYKDDGRYRVKLQEFFGVQVHFSALLGCLIVEFCEGLLIAMSNIWDSDSKDSLLLGWKNENWTILIMSLTWWTGSLILYLYKDVFYGFILAFTYFGIFSMQERDFCAKNKDSCSRKVSTAAVSLGSILIFFIFITIITYPKLVMYSVRKR